MKKTSILLASLIMMVFTTFAITSSPASKTVKFKVYGNCGMCENRIETAVKAIDGVSTADWDKETKMIEVSFDEAKTDIHKINMAIAAVGHDTDMASAKDDVYNNLPGCCLYERAPKKDMGMDMGMKHDMKDHSSCKSKGMKMGGKSCCGDAAKKDKK